MPTPRTLLAGLLLTLAAVPVWANGPNLLQNPGFDRDVSGWESSMFPVSWAPSDAEGTVHSGSARVAYTPTASSWVFGSGISQCIPVEAGKAYLFELHAWLDANGGRTAQMAGNLISFYSDDHCTAGALLTGGIGASASLPDRWVRLAQVYEAPPTAQTALVEVFGNVTLYLDDVYFGEALCAPNEETLCLVQGRFLVRARRDLGNNSSLPGKAMELGDNSGSFWIYGPGVAELTVKILDACTPALGNHYWVFVGGLTDQKMVLEVYDTKSGLTATYGNVQGTMFSPLVTLSYFPCP